MNVDFNNLRKQTAYALDSVIKRLNMGIMPETEYHRHEIDGKNKDFEGNLLVDTEDLQKDLDWLRSNVWTLLCVYNEGDPEFASV